MRRLSLVIGGMVLLYSGIPALAEGPYGESAEALIVVDVELRQPRVAGTQIADDLDARGYVGP